MLENFWDLRASDRLAEWKDFRYKIGSLPLPTALLEVNRLWSTAPYVTYNYLAPDEPTTWPAPWPLFAENRWCDVAKSLGIVYTIYFSNHKTVPIEIRGYYDYKEKTRHNLAWIDNGKYILNYYHHEIVNTELIEEKQLQLLYQYSTKDLQLEKY